MIAQSQNLRERRGKWLHSRSRSPIYHRISSSFRIDYVAVVIVVVTYKQRHTLLRSWRRSRRSFSALLLLRQLLIKCPPPLPFIGIFRLEFRAISNHEEQAASDNPRKGDWIRIRLPLTEEQEIGNVNPISSSISLANRRRNCVNTHYTMERVKVASQHLPSFNIYWQFKLTRVCVHWEEEILVRLNLCLDVDKEMFQLPGQISGW